MASTIVFDSGGDAEKIAFKRYTEIFSPYAEIMRVEGPFWARLEATRLSDFILYKTSLSGVSLSFSETHRTNSSARGALIVVQSGRLSWTDQAGDHDVAGPSMLVLDLARIERLTYYGAQLLYLAFEPAELSHPVSNIFDLHAATLPREMISLIGAVLEEILRHSTTFTAESAESEIISGLLSFLIRSHHFPAAQHRNLQIADRVKALVEQAPAFSWTASGIGRALGLSRASLYRKLQPSEGVTKLVLRARVKGARTALVRNPDTSLEHLGAEYGLGGRRRLDACFLAVTGETASSLQTRLKKSVRSAEDIASLAWADLLDETSPRAVSANETTSTLRCNAGSG